MFTLLFLRILTLHTNSHATSFIKACIIANKMNYDRADSHCYRLAIAIGLPGFNDLGLSVISIFLLKDHFLY